MSILVDYEIQTEVGAGRLIIDPFEEKLIQPNSIDVRLGRTFRFRHPSTNKDLFGKDKVIDPYKQETIDDGMTAVETDSFVIPPGLFVLGSTVEKFGLPNNIVGQLTGKSSLARLGIMVHVTAGFIDAGFSVPPATITLEIVNVGDRAVRLHAGMAIGQMVFTKTAECAVSYNQKRDAKYNGQKDAENSRYFLNKD